MRSTPRAPTWCFDDRRDPPATGPACADGALVPAYSGVRPKISGPSEAAADFAILGPSDHGVDGLVNLFGIESPGLTASLAIADRVAALLA